MIEIVVRKSSTLALLFGLAAVCGFDYVFGFEATVLAALAIVASGGFAVTVAGQDEFRWKI